MAHLYTSPAINTFLTDLLPSFGCAQSVPRCADFEFLAMECVDAYGALRGRQKCKDQLHDLNECLKQEKQFFRTAMMIREAKRQKDRGEDPGQLEMPPIEVFY